MESPDLPPLIHSRHASRCLLIALLFGWCFIGCSRNYTAQQMGLVTNETSRRFPGALVNREFFVSSGARSYLGRFFTEDEFQGSRSGVVAVSYKAWQNIFRSSPEVIGSRIQLDGRQTTTVGVAERGCSPGGASEMWIPKSWELAAQFLVRRLKWSSPLQTIP